MTGCRDGVARTFDATTGQLEQEIVGHIGRIWSTLYHRSGRIVSAAGDGSVRLWDPAVATEILGTKQIEIPDLETARSALDLGGGQWLVTPRFGKAVVLGDGRPEVTRVDPAGDAEIFAAAIDRPGRRIAFATNQGPIVHRFPDGGEFGEPLLAPGGFDTGVVAFGTEGWSYAGERDLQGSLMVWSPDLTTPLCLKGGQGEGGIGSVAFTNVPRPRLAMSKRAAITLYDLGADGAPIARSGRQLCDFGSELGVDIVLSWSPDGESLAVGAIEGNALIVDAESGSVVVELSSFATMVRGILWAHNGRSMIVADDRCIRLCDAVSGATLDEIRPGWAISSIGFVEGSDGRQLLAVTGSRLLLTRRLYHRIVETRPDDGRLLLLDLSRRLPAAALEE